MRRRMIAAATVTAMAATAIPAAFMTTSSRAAAVTATCYNSQQPVSGPVGCGTLFLPDVTYPHAGNALTLTATADAPWTPVTAEPMSGSPAQDWTIYLACTAVSEDRVPVMPCGSAGKPQAGRYVIEYTPGGLQPPGGTNSQQSLCLDGNGTTVTLANCQAGGAFYLPGYPYPPQSNGVPPAAQSVIAAETWIITSSGIIYNAASGLRLADPHSGGPGTPLTLSRGRGPATIWQAVGCTEPVTSLPGNAYYGCLS